MARPSFSVTISLIVLGLSLLYLATFGFMLYVSLREQVFLPPAHLPRYAGVPHYHNPVEWVLIVLPVLAGSVGTAGCGAYLFRRWLGGRESGLGRNARGDG